MNQPTQLKLLTIWIPTYRRPEQLEALLNNIHQAGLTRLAEVTVSDNDPGGLLEQGIAEGRVQLPEGVSYRCNAANLSAGVNFLRAFELSHTPWLMIIGDDDLFELTASKTLTTVLKSIGDSVLGIKFDSSLFGQQQPFKAPSLSDYVNQLSQRQLPLAFNNLCLVSNWLFRLQPYRNRLASAYLGYSSKISHLFPLLRACALDKGHMLFSPIQPVKHGTTDDSSWPKAATWYEMMMTLSSFSGFLSATDRRALLRLILHGDLRRHFIKCLRIHQFYGDRVHGVNPWKVHGHLALISKGYLLAFALASPLLLLPADRLPFWLSKRLGEPGSVERW